MGQWRYTNGDDHIRVGKIACHMSLYPLLVFLSGYMISTFWSYIKTIDITGELHLESIEYNIPCIEGVLQKTRDLGWHYGCLTSNKKWGAILLVTTTYQTLIFELWQLNWVHEYASNQHKYIRSYSLVVKTQACQTCLADDEWSASSTTVPFMKRYNPVPASTDIVKERQNRFLDIKVIMRWERGLL